MLENIELIRAKRNVKLKGFIEVNFKVNLRNKKKIKIFVMTVAIAAP